MQLTFNRRPGAHSSSAPVEGGCTGTLADLREGEAATLDRIDLPQPASVRLMELGFLPGSIVTAARRAPGGDPRVFRVDGSEIALRRDTAERLMVTRIPQP